MISCVKVYLSIFLLVKRWQVFPEIWLFLREKMSYNNVLQQRLFPDCYIKHCNTWNFSDCFHKVMVAVVPQRCKIDSNNFFGKNHVPKNGPK